MTRVVVVGHGMVGSRFVEELLRRDEHHRFEVTVLGAEPYEPYNRVLLSEVVSGTVDVATLTLPAVPAGRAVVRTGVAAVRIDRATRTVLAEDASTYPYDQLVLATGAAARRPDLPGLICAAGTAVVGAHPLRTLDDAREIVAASRNARTAVVLGGGVLGLEVACGLARRGLRVRVVHTGAHLMDRQLDAEAATVLASTLTGLGVDSVVGATAREVLSSAGRVSGLVLSDGQVVPGELLVLACGTVPRTALADAAELGIDRGVLVGADLGCPGDPSVAAIGDCAQPPGGTAGLVAQGWDQARRLATALVSGRTDPVPPDGPGRDTVDVVRLKAPGLDVLTFGAGGGRAADQPRHRVLRLSDAGAGRHLEVVVQDGRLVGATCVGAGALGAELTAAYLRGTPTPVDPAQLLLRSSAVDAGAAAPTLMPERTTVCRCSGVTKGDLVAAWGSGCRDLAGVARATRATTGCGGCVDVVSGLLAWLQEADGPEQQVGGSSQPTTRAGERSVAIG